ncbi:MAG: alcohol dehydrogenase [Candidatus Poribacteria bacterium]|nr:MAG: alcohol dehydrogenase [Candidatus Poribacteria bacterium]
MVEEQHRRFYFPSVLECGPGAIKSLPEWLRRWEVSRPLIVTDPGVREAGLLDRLLKTLEGKDFHPTVFSEIRPNPTDRNVYAGSVHYTEGRCDGLVALGGGSVIDAAKAIRVLVSHSCQLSDLYAEVGGIERIRRPMAPLVAVPTTSGTGSEVSRMALITDTQQHRKRRIVHPRLIPTLAILDPELVAPMPPFLTKTTGADALVHAVDAYVAPGFDPIADGIAFEAIRLIVRALPEVVEHPGDLKARMQMQLAAAMGGLASHKGGSSTHVLANALTERLSLPHGLASAVVLPYVMLYNLEAARERYAEIAWAMGVENVGALTTEEAAYAAVRAIRRLWDRLGLPQSLQELGVQVEMIPELAADAMRDEGTVASPREFTERDLRTLFETALQPLEL